MNYCELERSFSCHDCKVLTRRLDCHNNRLRYCRRCRRLTMPAAESGVAAWCPVCERGR